jgi:hypothetical protein
MLETETCNECEDGVILDNEGCLTDFCECKAGRTSLLDYLVFLSQGIEDAEVPLR